MLAQRVTLVTLDGVQDCKCLSLLLQQAMHICACSDKVLTQEAMFLPQKQQCSQLYSTCACHTSCHHLLASGECQAAPGTLLHSLRCCTNLAADITPTPKPPDSPNANNNQGSPLFNVQTNKHHTHMLHNYRSVDELHHHALHGDHCIITGPG